LIFVSSLERVRAEKRWPRGLPCAKCKAIMMDDVSPVAGGRFLYPTYIGVRVKDIEVANERCEGRSRCKNAMTSLMGDFIEHVNEIEKKAGMG
jgi:hypothetical protein